MTDLATVTAAVASVKHAIDIAKFLRDSKISLSEAEAKLKLADLMTALADAKMELASVQETLLAQSQEIGQLKAQSEFSGKMQFEQPYYWNLAGGNKEGPFCQPCWDSKQSAIRLNGGNNGRWRCRVCNQNFLDKTHVAAPAVESRSSWVDARR